MAFPPVLFMSRRQGYLLRMCTVPRGVTRLDGAGARSKFGAPMLELGVFRKQTCCIEESTGDIAGTFRRPGNCLCPSLRPSLCSNWLKPSSATYVVGNTQGRTGLLNRPGHSHYAGPGPCNEEQQKAITANAKVTKIGVPGVVA